jgi:predicted kinase
MPICYQLIGVPGSGKSTWISNQNWISDFVVVSTDDYVEKFARRMNQTYSEVFDKVMPRAVRLMVRKVNIAKRQGKDIIWDQTSTTQSSRKKKFRMLPEYDHIAVVFSTPNMIELQRRLNSREGKNIPAHVVSTMIKNFEMPSESEGFVEIWYAS